ncbi:hypothetical protein D3C81_1370370 [compost metagenome]
MIFGNPLNKTAPNTVTPKVMSESVICVGFGVQACVASLLIQPAIPAATGINSRPINATMAPIAAGGNTTSIHFVPAYLTSMPMRMKMRPVTINAPNASEYPLPGLAASTTKTGEINAKLEPRYAGILPLQMKM